MIAIIDYGMGNLRSVQKGFEQVGVTAEIVQQPEELKKFEGLVLPGVGAFKDAMDNLQEAGMIEAIHESIKEGKPFLGICLGFQLLFETSEEWGLNSGLGLFPGQVRRFDDTLKVPHMGWNQIEIQKESPILRGIPNGSSFYFVHSYYAAPGDKEVITTLTDNGIKFTSIVDRDNVFGIQFHPEKSSTLGLKILENFGRLVKC